MSESVVEPLPPSPTLYCRNINDKVHQNDIVANLYELFIPFGEVVSVNAIKSKAMRGQAFVSFRDENAAIAAHRKLQGHMVLGQPITIQFAKTKSDVLTAAEGGPRPKRRKTIVEAK